MPTTQITEFTGSVDTVAARTDAAGDPVQDWAAEERRMAYELFDPGVIPTVGNAWRVAAGGSSTMNIVVGSGSAKTDIALIAGMTQGQGRYLVRLDEVSKTIALDASSPSSQRIDEVYIVMYDNLYDTSSRSLPRLAVRKGDAGSGVPGPDGSWEAFLLIAEVTIPAAAADITECTIVDKREAINIAGGGGQVGDIKMTAMAGAPLGWLLCNGGAYPRDQYARLFGAIGTTFGPGDGSTTFNVPDFRGRYPFGKAASGTGSTMGAKFGSLDHVHSNPTTSTSATHQHSFSDVSTSAGSHNHGGTNNATVPHTHQLVYNTSGASHGFHSTSGGGGSIKRHKLDGVGAQDGEDTNNGTGSSHAHGISNDGNHNHTVSGTSGSSGAHSHTQGNTGGANPPSIAINFVIKY